MPSMAQTTAPASASPSRLPSRLAPSLSPSPLPSPSSARSSSPSQNALAAHHSNPNPLHPDASAPLLDRTSPLQPSSPSFSSSPLRPSFRPSSPLQPSSSSFAHAPLLHGRSTPLSRQQSRWSSAEESRDSYYSCASPIPHDSGSNTPDHFAETLTGNSPDHLAEIDLGHSPDHFPETVTDPDRNRNANVDPGHSPDYNATDHSPNHNVTDRSPDYIAEHADDGVNPANPLLYSSTSASAFRPLSIVRPASDNNWPLSPPPTHAIKSFATRHSFAPSDSSPRARRTCLSLFRPTRSHIVVTLVVLAAIMLAALVLCILIFVFHATALQPVANLGYGRYQGMALGNGVSQWLGMRYANAPVGDLRFRAPQPPSSFEGIMPANKFGPGCPGQGAFGSSSAEDCLYLDVFAPTDASPEDLLPVFVFIQGGGFAASIAHFNGSELVLASNLNMITVSMTYRSGPFGFLASSEVANNGSLNNGLLDQRQAMQWVQDHISAFGGDPNHVTLGGQSAGGGSVVQHLVAENGTDHGLFHAAIIESPAHPVVRTVDEQRFQYLDILNRTGCGNVTDGLTCLRNLDAQTLASKIVTQPYPGGGNGTPVFYFGPVVDGTFVTDLPARSLQNGNFIHVPTIVGDDTNEGIIFTPDKVNTTQAGLNFLHNNWPDFQPNQLQTMSDLYFDAHNTSSNTSGAPSGSAHDRAAMAYGETRYICPAMSLGSLFRQGGVADVYNWRYDVVNTANATDTNSTAALGSSPGPSGGVGKANAQSKVGQKSSQTAPGSNSPESGHDTNHGVAASSEPTAPVTHGAELIAVWGPDPVVSPNVSPSPSPSSASAAAGSAPVALSADNRPIVPVVQDYWASFIVSYDPNRLRAVGSPVWDRWNGTNRLLLRTNETAMETVPQPQLDRCKYLASIAVDLKQ